MAGIDLGKQYGKMMEAQGPGQRWANDTSSHSQAAGPGTPPLGVGVFKRDIRRNPDGSVKPKKRPAMPEAMK